MLLPLASAALLLMPAPADTVTPTQASWNGIPETTVAHPLATAASAGLVPEGVEAALDALREAYRANRFPGGAIVVGRGDAVVVERGIGRTGWSERYPAVRPDRTIFDLASLTKVLATTTAVMLLVEDGLMALDDPVADYIPFFHGEHRDSGPLRMTIRDLLTHTSGLPAGTSAWGGTPGVTVARLLQTPSIARPGQGVIYSDVGFAILWLAAERAAGEPLHRLLDRRVFSPLGLYSFTFLPGEACPLCAPTGVRPDGTPLRGVVHDPLARRLGGIAGHAGLFGTAHDVARFAAMMANGGVLDGVRVFQEETVRTFTRRQPWAATRALGWDTRGNGAGAAGRAFSPFAFGHTGFTGTSLWVDPDTGLWVVILTNHTYDTHGRRGLQTLRRAVHERVAGAVLSPVPALGGI